MQWVRPTLDPAIAAAHIDFEGIGFAMLSSPTLRSALVELARYLALISSATTLELAPDAAGAWVVMGHSATRRPIPPQRSAYSLLAVLSLCQWITRGEIHPREAHFGFATPLASQTYEGAFGCPVRFGQPDHRFPLASADLQMAIPTRDPQLLALHERALDERLAGLGPDSLSRRVAEAIANRLPGGEPRRADVAESMALTERTLQRQLEGEQTSFNQLLDDTRRRLAEQYLADRRYPLAQVALLIGFRDESNFTRACRRWFGQPPGLARNTALQERRQPP